MMTTFESKTTWKDAYDRNGLGGLLGAPLSPMRGFGSLLLVILALSIVANSVPNSYSFALSAHIAPGSFGTEAGADCPSQPSRRLVAMPRLFLGRLRASLLATTYTNVLLSLSFFLVIVATAICTLFASHPR